MKIEATNQKLQNYDILAVKPETEKAFAFAANHCDVDLISLDLGSKLPFYIKKTTVNMAVQKGIYFEIAYAPCIRDSNARKNIIANIQQFLRVTGGKNIIISSEAARALDIRSPLDIMNLAQVFGIPDKCAREAITTSCRSVLYHAATRRDTMKGFVAVEPLSVLSEGVKWKLGDAPTDKELEMGADFVSFGDMSGFEDADMKE
ncbi:RNase P subunit p30-domain-containing protein [Obelidium mucronatum]|nr:RNase P subunit p30-domain-containing protein [Obelidium mucronatum]